jgi:hypothetical protein
MPGKKPDVHDVLGAVSGLSREESKRILAEVRANMQLLEECGGPHDFKAVPPDRGRIPRKYKCRFCGGTVDSPAYTWYKRGLEHGRK